MHNFHDNSLIYFVIDETKKLLKLLFLCLFTSHLTQQHRYHRQEELLLILLHQLSLNLALMNSITFLLSNWKFESNFSLYIPSFLLGKRSYDTFLHFTLWTSFRGTGVAFFIVLQNFKKNWNWRFSNEAKALHRFFKGTKVLHHFSDETNILHLLEKEANVFHFALLISWSKSFALHSKIKFCLKMQK